MLQKLLQQHVNNLDYCKLKTITFCLHFVVNCNSIESSFQVSSLISSIPKLFLININMQISDDKFHIELIPNHDSEHSFFSKERTRKKPHNNNNRKKTLSPHTPFK